MIFATARYLARFFPWLYRETDCEAWCAACGQGRLARFVVGVRPSVRDWLSVHRLMSCPSMDQY